MNENNLEVKYLVLKIKDINTKLDQIDRDRFWSYVRSTIEK